jgi:hypothetical protein
MTETDSTVTDTEKEAPVKLIDRAGLVNIYDTLGQVKTTVDDVRWRWRASSMRKALEPIVEPITDQRDDVVNKRPKALDEARTALCKEYASLTPDGNPMISDNNFVIDPARKKAFDAAFTDLIERFKPERDAFDKLVKETNDWLKEEIPLPVIDGKIPLSAFNSTATQEMLETLFDYITDDSGEKRDNGKKEAKK